MTSTMQRFLFGFTLTIALSSCGLVADDEERLARAAVQMEAGEYRAAMIDLKNVLGGGSDSVAARMMLAQVSLGLGNPLSAEKELARAVELGADEAAVASMHFKILAAKGDHAGVLAALGMESFVLSDTEKLRIRGAALLGLGKFEVAEATYRDLLRLAPSSTIANIGLADALALGGDLESARNLLESVVAEAPNTTSAWHSLATIRFRSGKFESAEDAFIKASEALKPQTDVQRYASILAGLVESRLVLENIEAAHRGLDRLTGLAPNAPATLFLAARLARTDGDFALASRHLQKLLNISPDNAQAQLFLANVQMMQGSFAQAETLLNRVVAISPGNLQARKLLAQVQLQQSQPGGVVEALAPLLETASDDADLYTILGQASMQQGRSDKAIEQFQRAVDLAPDDIEAKLNLASAYFFADDAKSSIEILSKVAAGEGAGLRRERLLMMAFVANEQNDAADEVADSLLSSNSLPELATTVVADHYLRTGRGELARTVLREFVLAHPAMSNARATLGRMELLDGNLSVAQRLFSSILETDAKNLAAVMGLARISQLQGNAEEMVELLQQAAAFHPKATGPRVILAHEFLRNGRANEAEKRANELLKIGFNNSRISEIVASVCAAVGRTDDALLHFQNAVRLDPELAPAQLGIARAYLALERTVDARMALERALEISPGWPTAITILALVEIGQGQVDDAMRLVEEFQSLHPNNPAAFVLEGEVLFYSKDFAAAAAAFNEAVERGAGRTALLRGYQARVGGKMQAPEEMLEAWLSDNTEDTLTRKFLAQHYQASSRSGDAIREYEKVLARNPNDAAVLNNLAWHYQQDNRLQRALELAQRAYSIDPESGSIADTLGWVFYELGESKKSVDVLRKATQLSPNNGEIQYHYAKALSDSGETARARRILMRLKSSDLQFQSYEQADELLRGL